MHSLLGEEDIVIKSMAENYRNVPGVAGASILGDGRVSLILDVNAVIEMSTRAAAANRASPADADAASSRATGAFASGAGKRAGGSEFDRTYGRTTAECTKPG